ncbi:hypothetical protein LINPERPRIM_LOCUS5100 [Linum perenne]
MRCAVGSGRFESNMFIVKLTTLWII